MSDDSSIVPDEKKNAWRIVDYREEEVYAFVVRRNDNLLKVFKPTKSGLSDRLFDYRIFEVGIPYYENGKEERLLCNGLLRSDLDEMQQRKWDYFFRPIGYLVGLTHQTKIQALQQQVDEKRRLLSGPKALMSTWLLLAIACTIAIPYIGVAICAGIVFFLILCLNQWLKLGELTRQVNEIDEQIQQLIAEVTHLQNQIPKNIPSDKEIDLWYNEELEYLEQEAIESLSLDQRTIIELSEDLNPRGLKGLLIEDWGLIQPKKKIGKRGIPLPHLYGVVVGNDAKPRFSAYFLQFIFPTNDLISVYGCYYDFIRREQKGLFTDEYFYRNVVSVASKTEEYENNLDPKRKAETMMFRLTVSSGDKIEVALTDESVIDDMNKRFKAKNKLKKEKRRSFEEAHANNSANESKQRRYANEQKDEAYENLVKMAESELPATRARRVIAFIRSELRARAGIGEPA